MGSKNMRTDVLYHLQGSVGLKLGKVSGMRISISLDLTTRTVIPRGGHSLTSFVLVVPPPS